MKPSDELKKLAKDLEATQKKAAQTYVADKDGIRIEIYQSDARGGAGSWSKITGAPADLLEKAKTFIQAYASDAELEDKVETEFGEAVGKIAEDVLFAEEVKLFAQANPDMQEWAKQQASKENVTPEHYLATGLYEGLAGEAIPTKVEGNVIYLEPQVSY